MRILLGLLAALLPLGAAEYAVWPAYGPGTLYRGYNMRVFLLSRCYDALTVSAVDTVNNRITINGHGMTGTVTLGFLVSGGTLPNPINTFRTYSFTRVDDNTLSTTTDIDSTGSGTIKAGRDLGYGACGFGSDAPYVDSITYGGSAGIAATVYTGPAACAALGTGCRLWTSGGESMIVFAASAGATLGATTATVTIKTPAGGTLTQVYAFTVADIAPVTQARPASYPAVPGKAAWAAQMTTLGQKWCQTSKDNPGTIPSAYVNDQSIAFYDGAWTFYQLADYTGDAAWKTCADSIIRQYYTSAADYNGGFNALFLYDFFQGAKRACASCDGRYRYMVKRLIEKMSAGTPFGGGFNDFELRETSYFLIGAVNYRRIFGAWPPVVNGSWMETQAERAVVVLLSDLDVLFVKQDPILHQIFFDGLAFMALIDYWEMRKEETGLDDPDPRIPVLVKAGLDWIWANAWNSGTKDLAYNPYPYGPRCQATPSSCLGGADSYGWGNTLMGMVAPAFAWYWSITGDDTYRVRGDDLFENMPKAVSGTADPTTDRITIPDGGIQDGDRLEVHNSCYGVSLWPCANTIPAPFGAGTVLYARDVSGDSFKVSYTQGGSAIDITSAGSGFLGGAVYWLRGKTPADFTGKVYNEQFRWTFDYVNWREGRKRNRP